ALKYSGASRLAPMLARPAAPSLRTLVSISGPAALVPVPVHAERRRERGYNQAELIARALGPSHLILERVRPTTKQHRLDRAARLANLRGAFRVASGVSVPPVAVLVDDIITTTATLEACASVLRETGVEAVYGFAVAREV
ncbi:MAG TPA: ComF family protein, partial [Candidatus Limnocylindria bacterium]